MFSILSLTLFWATYVAVLFSDNFSDIQQNRDNKMRKSDNLAIYFQIYVHPVSAVPASL